MSDRARGDIEEIAAYLAARWSEKAKLDFLLSLTQQIDLISKMPYMYRASASKSGVRECVMKKHTLIYYEIVNDDLIRILTIRNTRKESI
ncbi:type II toxin-antitoxin system RelE/ParE family toxin [Dyadobacter crusticola]|uniref:type II toxin-antitoxin system RelE/ParE family toxin n=1 Tax=Dyadobacter crusticola TaxID=292407 RepID=UPI000A003C92